VFNQVKIKYYPIKLKTEKGDYGAYRFEMFRYTQKYVALE